MGAQRILSGQTSQLNAGTDFGSGFFCVDRCASFAASGLRSLNPQMNPK
jgi:hypothetical protein